MLERTLKLGNRINWMPLVWIMIGLFIGWILLQVLNRGWIFAVIVLAVIFVPLIALNAYRAWVILLFATMVSFYRYDIGQITLRFDQLALLLLIGAWILGFLYGRNRLHHVPLLLPAIGYIAVNFIATALYAPDKATGYQTSFLLIVYMLMYVFSVIVLQDRPNMLKKAVKVLLLFGFIQAAYGLTSLIANSFGIFLGGVSTTHVKTATSISGGFQEPNIYAAFMAVVSLIFIALLASENGMINKRKASIGLGFVLVALIFTYTRASWVGFLAGLIMLVFIQKPQRNLFNPRTAAIAFILVLLLLLVIIPLADTASSGTVGNRISEILNFSGGSAEGRIEVQRSAIERWKNAVLLGNGTLSLPPVEPAGAWIYSSMLQALHDTGLFGLAFLLWFQIGAIMIILKSYNNTSDPLYRASLAGFAAALIAMMIASQASSFLWLGFPWIFTGLALAVAQTAPLKEKF